MSKTNRVALVVVAVLVVVVAFVIAQPGGDSDDKAPATTAADSTTPTATAPSAPKPPADAVKDEPTVIELTGHEAPKVTQIKVKKGDRVRLVVKSDLPDDIHVHGYDISRTAGPGSPARFSFVADIEGVFEIESHEAEHVGANALIANLVVEPS